MRLWLSVLALLAFVSCAQAQTAIFSSATPDQDTGWNGYSIRTVATPLTGGGSQVRVVFSCVGNANVCATDHVAVCIQSTTYDCTATPVELKFGGVSGFSITVSGGQTCGGNPCTTLTSDFANLTVTSSNSLLVIWDSNASTGAGISSNTTAGNGCWYKSATASYNVQNPTGTWTNYGTHQLGFEEIDAQTPAGVVGISGGMTQMGTGP